MIVEHLRDGQLDYELEKCDELRQPPLPVTAWLLLDSAAHDGLLYGWAANPNSADDAGLWEACGSSLRGSWPTF